jgi:hypothetical protein
MAIDDGTSRYVLHYSEPHVEVAVAPEFSLADIDLFTTDLSLSESQQQAVQRAIQDYLDAFAKLVKDKHPLRPAAQAAHGNAGHPDNAAGELPPPDAPTPQDEERATMRAIVLEELKNAGYDVSDFERSPYRPSIGISVSMSDDESGAPPEPDVNVNVSFGGEDDGLSPETRETLKPVADRIAKRLAEHVKARETKAMAQPREQRSPREEIEARWNELQQIRQRLKEFLKAKEQLRNELFTAVQSILSQSQLDQWPRLIRTLTRVKTLPWADMDGEQTDLLAILAESGITVETPSTLAEHCGSYADQLHAALVRRNEMLADIDAEIDMAMYEGRHERALSLADRITKARLAVRTINEQFAELLASDLPDEAATAFRAAFLHAAYPRVYRETLAARCFKEAAKLTDLTDSVRKSLNELAAGYDLQLGELNQRLRLAIRDQDASELKDTLDRVIAEVNASSEEDVTIGGGNSIAEDFQRRQELDMRSVKSLYAMLLPEQIAKLPRIPELDVSEPVQGSHEIVGSTDEFNQ